MTNNEIEVFTLQWLELWPTNVVYNGVNIKSSVKECLPKMQKFIRTFPEYTVATINDVTKHYLAQQAAKDWNYTKRAHFFISKVGEASLLETLCRQFTVEPEKPKLTSMEKFPFNEQSDFIN